MLVNTLFRLRGALSCLRDAVDCRSRDNEKQYCLHKNVIITTLPSGQRKLYCPQATLFHLRDALSCLRDAVDRRSRRPEGRIMHPSGKIMWPSGSIISIIFGSRL